MLIFSIVCYWISLVLSVIALIVGTYVGIKRSDALHSLPRALRWYLLTSCFPYFFITSMCAIYTAAFYLLNNTIVHFSIEMVRIILAFCAQQIRNTFLTLVLERLYATVKLDQYKLAHKMVLFWWLTIFSCATSLFYVGYTTFAVRVPSIPLLYNVTSYFVYLSHVLMIVICIILYFMNRRMYKFSAYRLTLKRRYTIVENIKVLSYLFPSILIYTLLAQFGSLTSIIFQALGWPSPPVCIFHIFWNLSFLLIYLRHYYMKSEDDSVINNKIATSVKNPLGQNIPTNVNMNDYFKNLQNQWK